MPNLNKIAIKEMLKTKYRPDIDGLRGIAILSVVIFHFFPNLLRGGFVGVDIFFVISGFLISRIILEDLESGKFTFTNFYLRRAKRILPALIVILILSCVFGFFILTKEEYQYLGKHVFGAGFFSSNFLLRSEAGYFDPSADFKPLQHLWSLAVEEQFYIIWPFFLFFLWRANLNIFISSILAAILSFSLNIESISSDKLASFYLPQTRFWELLFGSILAQVNFNHEHRAPINTFVRGMLLNKEIAMKLKIFLAPNILSFAGFLLIIYGCFRINKFLPFPGFWALVPALGASLLIFGGPKSWINRFFLSNKILVWIGLISYPLYLWHWTLLSFARVIMYQLPPIHFRLVIIFISFFLAWVTYEFIEKPIRYGINQRMKILFLIPGIIVMGLFGLAMHTGKIANNANLNSKTFEDISVNSYFHYMQSRFYPCTPETIYNKSLKFEDTRRCFQSKISKDIDIAIIGDSHAEHLFSGFSENMPQKNVVYYIQSALPFLGVEEFEDIFQAVINNKNIKYVFIAANWSSRYSNIPSKSSLNIELSKVSQALIKAGKKVYVFNDIPTFTYDAQFCLGRRWPFDNKKICEMSTNEEKTEVQFSTKNLREFGINNPAVNLVDLHQYFCKDSLCSMTENEIILYRDDNHLNVNGSRILTKKVLRDNPGMFN